MNKFHYALTGILFSFSAMAAEDPIAWKIISESMPSQTNIDQTYQITYQFTSNFPFQMPSPLNLQKTFSSDAFSHIDNCGVALHPGQSCTLEITFNPDMGGHYHHGVTMQYGGTVVPLPTSATTSTKNWVGVIGVDYNPNHYPNTIALNNHDVFYVGTANSLPITNVYMELAQLQAAGFTVARSYQTIEYSWIDIINQAQSLGMQVVYEAVIPQNGSQSDIDAAMSVLNNVIAAVGTTTFQNTVVLVFAGHENYSSTDMDYLTSAISQLQTTLTTNNLVVPVSSALVSGDLIAPPSQSDIQSLFNSYSPTAPLGFDPYPFQWGVTTPDQAVTNMALQNSIAWDYQQVTQQSIYPAGRTILMAETGWATSGSGAFAGYYCAVVPVPPTCAPSVNNAGTYLSTLYSYVMESNNAGALVFEAYDEPAKDPINPDNAENHYGVFNSNCNPKIPTNSTSLFPSGTTPTETGCQGFIDGGLLVVVGLTPSTQSPFTVAITQTNPVTSASASMTVNVPNIDRTNQNVNPWPQYLVFTGATLTITGSTPGNVCTYTPATVNSGAITWGSTNCTGLSVSCSSNVCYLPAGY